MAPSVSSLILEGGSATLDGVAAAAPGKCVGCSADAVTSSCAQIVGGRGVSSHRCTHTVCMHCFGLAHALRSAVIKLKCPGSLCAYQSRRWIVYSPVASRTGGTQSWQQIELVLLCEGTLSDILTFSSSISLISTGMFTLFSHW